VSLLINSHPGTGASSALYHSYLTGAGLGDSSSLYYPLPRARSVQQSAKESTVRT